MENKIWYIMTNNQKYGPFTYQELIEFNQRGELLPNHYLWMPQFNDWQRFNQTKEFQKETIKEYFNSTKNSEVFYPRRFARFNYCVDLIGHNQVQSFSGKCFSISEGGALVELNNPFLLPRERINLHFIHNQSTFQMIGEITNKEYLESKLNKDTPIRYTVRFLQLQSEGIHFIRSLNLTSSNQGEI